MAKYGAAPIDLGRNDLASVEMMFWLYCPVKMAGDHQLVIPDNLHQFRPLIETAREDCWNRWRESYVYISAKRLFVSPENPMNRPGWHSDGFMTDDINYVWSDRDGTFFWEPKTLVHFSQNHETSLHEMEAVASNGPVVVYPDKHFLRLDETVIHRVADLAGSHMRSFVKISVSRHQYNLVGNSINHRLPNDWYFAPRSVDRNHPAAEA